MQPSAVSVPLKSTLSRETQSGGAVHPKQVWTVTKNAHNRFSTFIWCAGWTIPLILLTLAISVPFWRSVSSDIEQAIARQVDYEDALLCVHFGFIQSTDEHANCKAALLDLRRNHERLMAATSIP